MPGRNENTEQEEELRVRFPKDDECIGYVEQLVGGKRMYVECSDGKRRLCRVPGRLRRRLWVREGDYVIVKPWEVQGDEKGDIIWKYKPVQVEVLRKKGLLKWLE